MKTPAPWLDQAESAPSIPDNPISAPCVYLRTRWFLVYIPVAWLYDDMATKKRKTPPMSDEHKAALAEGRAQGRAVRNYLEALAANKPKRGRRRTQDSITKRLAAIEDELVTADPLKQLQLTQERFDLTAELESTGDTVDISALEKDFIAAAGPYSERKKISYAAFRAVGVTPEVLRKAGIRRSS